MIRERPKSSISRRKRRRNTSASYRPRNRRRPFSSHVYQTKRTTTICSRSTSQIHDEDGKGDQFESSLFTPSNNKTFMIPRGKKKRKKDKKSGKKKRHVNRYHRQHRSIEMQRNIKLEKLRKENDNLLKQIDQYTEEKVQNFNSIKNRMGNLNDLADEFVRKITTEKQDLLRLEKKNINLDKQIQEQKKLRNNHQVDSKIRKFRRKENIGVLNNSSNEANARSIHDQRISGKNKIVQIEKQISILESKLDLNQKKLNLELSKNAERQEEIRKLRNEKKNFNQIYKKIEKELIQKQNEIATIIEDSNSEYEERETILREIHRIKQIKNLKKYEFQYKLKELDRIIKKDNLILKKLKENFSQKKEQGEEHMKLKKKVLNTRWNLMESRAQKFVTKEKIQQLREMFDRIEEETEMKIDVLIEKLSESSEIHFGLFDYINKLNLENEKLEKENENLRNKIYEQEKKNEKENRSKHRLTQLQEKISIIETENKNYDEKVKYLREIVIKKLIIREKLVPLLKLFHIIPDDDENENDQNDKEEKSTNQLLEIVNEVNLIDYAGRIEEILNLFITYIGQTTSLYSSKKKEKEEKKKSSIKSTTTTTTTRVRKKSVKFLLDSLKKAKVQKDETESSDIIISSKGGRRDNKKEESDSTTPTTSLFIGPKTEKIPVSVRKKHMQSRIRKELGDVRSIWGSFSRRNLFQNHSPPMKKKKRLKSSSLSDASANTSSSTLNTSSVFMSPVTPSPMTKLMMFQNTSSSSTTENSTTEFVDKYKDRIITSPFSSKKQRKSRSSTSSSIFETEDVFEEKKIMKKNGTKLKKKRKKKKNSTISKTTSSSSLLLGSSAKKKRRKEKGVKVRKKKK